MKREVRVLDYEVFVRCTPFFIDELGDASGSRYSIWCDVVGADSYVLKHRINVKTLLGVIKWMVMLWLSPYVKIK